MGTQCSQIQNKLITCCLVTLGTILFYSAFIPPSEAAAPTRSVPYDETALCGSQNVFFCEDWEADDIRIHIQISGKNRYDCFLGNPALMDRNGDRDGLVGCGTLQGGTVQHPLRPLPLGPDTTSNNKVWRIAKGGQSFTDIVTGVDPGFGQGSFKGFLRSTKGDGIKGVRAYYVRYQYYYSSDYDFPEQYDSKQVFTQPLTFIDNPSASYQNGTYISRTRCSGFTVAAEEAFVLRRSNLYQKYPITPSKHDCSTQHDEPLIGRDYPGVIKPGAVFRWDTDKWRTVEYYVKLESKLDGSANDGDMKLWIDNTLVLDTAAGLGGAWNGDVCGNPCEDLAYIFAGAYQNVLDSPHNGFADLDNLVMSRTRIGLPGSGGTSTGGSTPQAPTGLSIQLNATPAP